MRTPTARRPRRPRRPLAPVLGAVLATLLGTVLGACLVALPTSTAQAASRWAPADRATITPGVQMYTDGAQCTANFVFTDRRERVYVGYAAHCAGRGEATDTNGCETASLPLGTRVRFASNGSLVDAGETVGHGRLVYSSWRTMRRVGTTSRPACTYNDFALVRVSADDVRKVNPSVPFFGGPTGLRSSALAVGDEVHSYGSSSLRGDADPLSPKSGAVVEEHPSGWSHTVYTATPGIPGDSGSGFLDADGRAFGTLSTVALAPLAGSNGVSDLGRELAFAQRHGGIPGLRLVRGTEPFAAPLG